MEKEEKIKRLQADHNAAGGYISREEAEAIVEGKANTKLQAYNVDTLIKRTVDTAYNITGTRPGYIMISEDYYRILQEELRRIYDNELTEDIKSIYGCDVIIIPGQEQVLPGWDPEKKVE